MKNAALTIFSTTVVMIAMIVAGCGEPDVITLSASDDATDDDERLATVTPEFRVNGLDEVPQQLWLEQLGLSVQEIRLEPLRGNSGVAYATSDPLELTFDIASGEHSIEGETVQFPETGRFLVSMRLEPAQAATTASDDEFETRGSLNLRGRVRSEYLASEDDDEKEEGDISDGNPLPLPVQRIKDPSADDGMWTPFELSSDRVVFYTFSDVKLVPGEQTLTFSFNLNDWATGAVTPIIDAVERVDSEGVVDVSHEMDPTTSDPETLLDAGSVSTATH